MQWYWLPWLDYSWATRHDVKVRLERTICLFVCCIPFSISGHFINSSYTLSHHSSCSLVRRGPDISACNICVKCRSRISVVPGRQAGRHDWFYYTSTKCAIRSQMTWQDSNASRKHSWPRLSTNVLRRGTIPIRSKRFTRSRSRSQAMSKSMFSTHFQNF
jgi:hypothetical protein